MEVNNDGSPPRPEGPKTSPEPSKPASPEHELTSSSTRSPPPRPLRPTSPDHKLNYPSTSSPPSEPPIPASPESELASSSTSSPPPEPPIPALPESELASSSTSSPPPEPPIPSLPESELASSSTSSPPPESPRHTPPPPDLASSSNTAPSDGGDENEWVISIKEKLDQFSQPNKEVWSRYSIFRAPRNLRKMERKAYTPQFISIGPFHRGQPHLRLMEAHKWRFLHRSLDRTRQDLDVYIRAISSHVAETRGCYALITDHMSNQEFLEMMLLDSCFILELLIAVAQGPSRRGDDPLFDVRAVVLEIRRDMLLLENQIPFFILEKLFPLTAGSFFRGYSVSRLALFFFNWTVPGSITEQTACDTGNEKVLHFLHLIRQSLIPLQYTRSKPPHPPPPPSKPSGKFIDNYKHKHLRMRCVSMLVDSGVKFRKTKSNRLTNIEFDFKRGILKIPPLVVDDSTKSILLNLMAFEQCYPKCSDDISSYVVFMDGLINTPGDVAHLQQKGIINYHLGSEKAVAQLFNDLCRDISIDYMYGSHVFALCLELNKYVSLKCPTWKASLRREHFRHPWSFISFGAAVFIIGLTLTQAVYAILTYHVHHS